MSQSLTGFLSKRHVQTAGGAIFAAAECHQNLPCETARIGYELSCCVYMHAKPKSAFILTRIVLEFAQLNRMAMLRMHTSAPGSYTQLPSNEGFIKAALRHRGNISRLATRTNTTIWPARLGHLRSHTIEFALLTYPQFSVEASCSYATSSTRAHLPGPHVALH